jgi:putative transposase
MEKSLKSNSNHHARRSLRVPGYDYSQPGAYFVTVCTNQHQCLFGTIVKGKMQLNTFGNIANTTWIGISDHTACVELGEFCVMPNHIHGIIILVDSRGKACLAPTGGVNLDDNRYQRPQPGSLGVIVGSYKSTVTRRINILRDTTGISIWQRNYYEHIIRNDDDLRTISEYIATNPLNWGLDELHTGN